MSDYWDSVESIAEEVREEYPNPRAPGRDDMIHESVDGTSWIIYYGENEDVLRETNNEPDPEEVRAMSSPNADWKQMRTTAAYLAMVADVHEKLRELDERSEEEETELDEDVENVEAGNRVELLEMPDDPDPIPYATKGTVTNVNRLSDFVQISVEWDNGRALMLTVPPDKFLIVQETTPPVPPPRQTRLDWWPGRESR